mmetsp:Transcript_97119/g.258071  ORF Transcript_97119/g.258071 Transcript_97119/m.258071 type:complete len:187 (-) Transcript_97119:94-654(-)
MRLLLCVGLLPGAGGLLTDPAAEPVHRASLVARDAGGHVSGAGDRVRDPRMPELDPRYRFICVWRHPEKKYDETQYESAPFTPLLSRLPEVIAQFREERQSPLDLGPLQPGEYYMDPCILGLKKLTWAIVLCGLSLVTIIFCIPFLLVISRRRPPGQPLFPDCCCFDCCCAPKRPPLPPTLHFATA